MAILHGVRPIRALLMLLATGWAMLLAGCDALQDPAVKDCEASIVAGLRAPSTYKRITASSSAMTDLAPQQLWVSVEYDAANAYGTPIRDRRTCKYRWKQGEGADLAQRLPDDAPIRYADAKRQAEWEKEMSGYGVDTAAHDAQAAATDAAEAAAAAASAAAKSAAITEHEIAEEDAGAARCWQGYCPCDETNSISTLLCRNLRGGVEVSDELMAAGAAQRDAQASLQQWNRDNPDMPVDVEK